MRYGWLILASLLPAIACAQELTQVTVVHQKTYQVVATLSNTEALAKFDRHWKTKLLSKPATEPQWVYKIDVETVQSSDRWLYDPRGWTKLRSNTETPVYKLPASTELNTILGIIHP